MRVLSDSVSEKWLILLSAIIMNISLKFKNIYEEKNVWLYPPIFTEVSESIKVIILVTYTPEHESIWPLSMVLLLKTSVTSSCL